MGQKYFTVSEAESLIPKIEGILASVRELKRQAERKIGPKSEETSTLTDEVIRRSQMEFLIAEINRKLELIYNMGCFPKDLDMGLVDFPSMIDGKEAFLCWKLGEEGIGYWHTLTEGFSGRRPLPSSVHNT